MKEGGSRAGLQEDGWGGSGKGVKETTVAADRERDLTAGHPDRWSGRSHSGIRSPTLTDGTLRLQNRRDLLALTWPDCVSTGLRSSGHPPLHPTIGAHDGQEGLLIFNKNLLIPPLP